jgi:peptidoglycan/LPS O-acetylase OafA/YrhL
VTIEQRLAACKYQGPGFDLLRLLAASVVLLYHSRGVEAGDIQADPLFKFSGGFIQSGLLAVLVFFAISGFLVTPGLIRSRDAVVYLVHRAVRIFPALFVVVLVTMLALGPALTVRPLASYFADPDVYRYAKNAITLSVRYLPGVLGPDGRPIIVNGALWTLYFEVLSYLALALMCVLRRLRPEAFLILFLAAYAIYVSVTLDREIAAAMPDRFVTFIGLFVYFAAGAALFACREYLPYSKGLAFGALALVVIALPVGMGPVVLPICLPYVIVVCGLSRPVGVSFVKQDLSYGLYLIHAPVLVTLIVMCPFVKTWWMAAAIALPVTMVLSYLSWTYIEAPVLRHKKVISNMVSNRIEAVLNLRSRRRRAQVAISE